MAEVFISAFVSIILGNINSLGLKEIGITNSMKTELERLQRTFSTIQDVLSDAEVKQRYNRPIRNWLKKLKHTAYEAEDVLDDIAANTQRRSKVSTVFRLPKQVLFRLKMTHMLKDVRKKLNDIASERNFLFREGVEPVDDRKEREPTSSLANELEVYGRDKELEKAIGMVLNNSVDPVFVYAICGMGGLGKTALAQLVYNNQSIIDTFDLRGWVDAYDFNVNKLTKAIIFSIGGNSSGEDLDPLQRHLQEKLNGKRFLLVLDDVWNEDRTLWRRLKKAFTCGEKGSTVLVTTRSQKAANMMATAPTHVQHLKCLSSDDSWSLFKQCAFRMGKSEDYPHLEALGREIVKKCAGVPLAIKVLGDFLSDNVTERDCQYVNGSVMWKIEDELNILKVLKLSYIHLKPHLRQCFSFCSVFPKDFVMKKDELVQLWMANGFIPYEEGTNVHDKGIEIFNELVQRSFFQELDVHAYGTCKMNNLIHDLAQSIMSYECFTIQSEHHMLDVPQTVRHLFITGNKADAYVSCVNNLLKASSLHSMIGWCDFIFKLDDSRKLELELKYNRNAAKQKYLRVLELFGSTVMKISSFRHLRSLKVFRFEGKTLPDSICSLFSLQTLKLKDCYQLQGLPEGMKCLKNLIYLDIKCCYELTRMPPGLGQLSYLRVLNWFVVGKKHGCLIGELKELKLEGELEIRDLHNVKSSKDAESANLERKSNLRIVKLCWRENNV